MTTASEIKKAKIDRLAIAREKARQNRALGIKKTYPGLKTKYADMPEWERLASENKLRLPRDGTPVTTGGVEKWLKIIGLTPKDLCDWNAVKTLKEFVDLDPNWSMRAIAGCILEHKDLMLRMRSWPK